MKDRGKSNRALVYPPLSIPSREIPITSGPQFSGLYRQSDVTRSSLSCTRVAHIHVCEFARDRRRVCVPLKSIMGDNAGRM